MASITRKPTSRYWVACFTDNSGRQRQKSTKSTERAMALKLALQWEDAYRKGVTERQAHKALSRIREDLHGEKLPRATATAYLRDWLRRKTVENSPRTHERYEAVIDRYLAHLGARASDPLAAITREAITAWRDSLAATLSPATVNISIKILRSALNDAKRAGYIPENPAEGIVALRKDIASRRPFTPGEVQTMLAAAGDEWRGAILAGLYTGQRLGDIATLRWNEVNLLTREIAFTTQKTRRRVVLPIVEPLHRHLLSLPTPEKPTAPVFPRLCRRYESNGSGSLSNAFNDEVMAPAGLVKPRERHGKSAAGRAGPRASTEISFHSLRHTLTSLLKNAGVNDAVARDIVGHESAAVSRNYTHIDDAAKRRALAAIPDITATLSGKPGKASTPRR